MAEAVDIEAQGAGITKAEANIRANLPPSPHSPKSHEFKRTVSPHAVRHRSSSLAALRSISPNRSSLESRLSKSSGRLLKSYKIAERCHCIWWK